MSYKLQKRIILCTFLLFPMLLMVMFLIYPSFRLFQMSFTNWDGVLPDKQFVGFTNYVYAFTDSEGFPMLVHNIPYVITGLLQNIIGLLLAVILVSKLRGRNIFRSILFFPYIINSVAVAFMFNYMYDFTRSPINIVLQAIGMEPVEFIGTAQFVNVSLAAISFWRYLGFTIVIFVAALQSVAREMYEAAEIDGSNWFQTLRYITLPSIKSIVELNLFLSLSGALNAFIETMVITHGGPGSASRTFVYTIVVNAFQTNRFSFAAALSIILIILVLLITGIQRKVVLRDK